MKHLSLLMCGEDVETLESFIYLGSVVHRSQGACQEVLVVISLAYAVMDVLQIQVT